MADPERLRVILDTNVFLVSVSSRSPYHWIFQDLLDSRYELFITNDILLEYEETLSEKWNPVVGKNITRVLLLLPNVHQIQVFYFWNPIQNDPDDNKFVDCAEAANAHVLATHDRDFNILKNIEFAQVPTSTIEEFKELLHSG